MQKSIFTLLSIVVVLAAIISCDEPVSSPAPVVNEVPEFMKPGYVYTILGENLPDDDESGLEIYIGDEKAIVRRYGYQAVSFAVPEMASGYYVFKMIYDNFTYVHDKQVLVYDEEEGTEAIVKITSVTPEVVFCYDTLTVRYEKSGIVNYFDDPYFDGYGRYGEYGSSNFKVLGHDSVANEFKLLVDGPKAGIYNIIIPYQSVNQYGIVEYQKAKSEIPIEYRSEFSNFSSSQAGILTNVYTKVIIYTGKPYDTTITESNSNESRNFGLRMLPYSHNGANIKYEILGDGHHKLKFNVNYFSDNTETSFEKELTLKIDTINKIISDFSYRYFRIEDNYSDGFKDTTLFIFELNDVNYEELINSKVIVFEGQEIKNKIKSFYYRKCFVDAQSPNQYIKELVEWKSFELEDDAFLKIYLNQYSY